MKLLLWIALLLFPAALQAQQVISNSTPSGFLTLNIAAGTGTTSTISLLAAPLLNDANATGQVKGVITSLTANTISNSNAGWATSPTQLSNASAPTLIRITSGTASGRTFLVSTSTANTATTVTIDAGDAAQTDLTTLGIVPNTDTYELLAGYTLSSLLPSSSGVLTGTAPASADNVQLFVTGAWRQYYYNTTSGWLRIGLNSNANNLVIRPDTAIIYSRLANTPLSLVLTGSVPTTPAASVVANSGVSFVGNSWPSDLTLGTSNINSISGWVSNASPSSADIVQFFVSGAWRQYYFDPTNNGTTTPHWRRVGLNTVSDNQVIPAGTGVILSKQGAAAGTTLLSQSLPYNL